MGNRSQVSYSRLFIKFVFLTMSCSLVPLFVTGWVINHHYSRFAEKRIINKVQENIIYHRDIIALFLKENKMRLDFIARTFSVEDLSDKNYLEHILASINRKEPILTDIGLINDLGNHVAYAGPYDLMKINYAQTHWFKIVMEKLEYTSDMFMGFRKKPHFIMAVVKQENNRNWIIRATVNSDSFRALVESLKITKNCQACILNRDGLYQTASLGEDKILTMASNFLPESDPVSRQPAVQYREEASDRQIVFTAWLEDPQWQLMAVMGKDEIFEDMGYVNRATLTSLCTSGGIIFVIALLITGYMISVIRKRDADLEQMNQQLVQAGKLASIGELAAGVAHEINNPMAIIMTECMLMEDGEKIHPISSSEMKEQFDQSLSQIRTQTNRCKVITKGLLTFARRTRSSTEYVDINQFLAETVALMEREAKSDGITFVTRFDPDLPKILSDVSLLQQVFLNLINNAIDAHEGKGQGTVTLTTKSLPAEKQAHIMVEDTGCGISKKSLDHIFDPFYTTKPPGKGTGLGLSICYSIVNQLSGEIQVESQEEKGTRFTLMFPFDTES